MRRWRRAALAAAWLPVAAAAQAPAVAPLPAAAPHVADNSRLGAAATDTYPGGVWRDHYASGGHGDGPLFFMPQPGTCAAAGYADDGGDCVDGAGGNSWKALHQGGAMNVKEFGARGDNATDDTAAIQAAINAVENAAPGIYRARLVFPSGNYCQARAGGVTVSGATRIELIGIGDALLLSCGNTDTTVLTLNGVQTLARNLQIVGLNATRATQPALKIGAACTECIFEDGLAAYGYRAIDNAGVDSVVRYTKAYQAYGPSLARSTAGNFWIRDKFDQNYPTNRPPAGKPALAAWQARRAYRADDLVTIGAGAWVLQATAGDTSGDSEPTAPAYNIDRTDNTVTWQLAGPLTYDALQLDTGAAPVFIDKLDATGSFTAGLALTDETGGGAPQLVTVRDGNFGENLFAGIRAVAGTGLFVEGGSATNCVLAGCIGVDVQSSFGGTAHVGDGFIAYGNPIGLHFGKGGFLVAGATVQGATLTAVEVAAGVADWSVTANNFATGPWGANAVAVKVAPGAGDYYVIADNILHGAAIGVSDGGTGTHKTVTGNR